MRSIESRPGIAWSDEIRFRAVTERRYRSRGRNRSSLSDLSFAWLWSLLPLTFSFPLARAPSPVYIHPEQPDIYAHPTHSDRQSLFDLHVERFDFRADRSCIENRQCPSSFGGSMPNLWKTQSSALDGHKSEFTSDLWIRAVLAGSISAIFWTLFVSSGTLSAAFSVFHDTYSRRCFVARCVLSAGRKLQVRRVDVPSYGRAILQEWVRLRATWRYNPRRRGM